MRIETSLPRKLFGRLRRRLLSRQFRAEVRRRAELESLVETGNFAEAARVLLVSKDADQNALRFLNRFVDIHAGTSPVFIHHHVAYGRVEHYHHYVGAVLLPVMQLIDMGAIAPGTRYLVPDCGPMNGLLTDLAQHRGISVDLYPSYLSQAIARVEAYRHLHLPPYDRSHISDIFLRPHQINRVRRVAFDFAGLAEGDRPADWKSPSVLLVDRAVPHPFYSSEGYRYDINPEGSSGNARRSIPNIDELHARLSERCRVQRAFLEGMSFADQIKCFNGATVVVGQHGAGLNGLLWSRPGSAVLEIIPTNKLGEQFSFFSNIATLLSVRHYHLVQPTPHSTVDAAVVDAFLAAEMRDRAI